MADTTTMAMATGALVVGGYWAAGKSLNVRLGIGIGAYAIGLALLDQVNSNIAKSVSVLVLITVLFTWGHTIAYTTGLTNIRPVAGPGKDVRRSGKDVT